jgi:acetyl esterase/lipase
MARKAGTRNFTAEVPSFSACTGSPARRRQAVAHAVFGLLGLLGVGLIGCSPSAGDEQGSGGSGVIGQGSGGSSTGSGGSLQGSGGTSVGTGGAVITAGSGGTSISTGGSAGGTPGGSGGGAAGRSVGAAGGRNVGVSTGGSGPVAPPMLDPGSTIPVARQGGYTTDANVIYGPLPQQRLDVLYPPTGGPRGTQKLPGVIMFHGGGWIQGDKATMSSFYSRFLAHGFIVCTVEYRVANQGIAPAAVQDSLLAAKWFWDHLDYYNVDRTKYVVTGASAGGHLALMVGMADASANLGPANPVDFHIAAIVNGYGPADVTDMLRRNIGFAVSWLPTNTPNRDAIARQVSPVTYVRQDIPPLITVQGSNDTTVPVAEGQMLDTLLKAAGADAEHHLVAGAGHGFTTPATAWPDAEKTMFDFLVKHGIGR